MAEVMVFTGRASSASRVTRPTAQGKLSRSQIFSQLVCAKVRIRKKGGFMRKYLVKIVIYRQAASTPDSQFRWRKRASLFRPYIKQLF